MKCKNGFFLILKNPLFNIHLIHLVCKFVVWMKTIPKICLENVGFFHTKFPYIYSCMNMYVWYDPKQCYCRWVYYNIEVLLLLSTLYFPHFNQSENIFWHIYTNSIFYLKNISEPPWLNNKSDVRYQRNIYGGSIRNFICYEYNFFK